MRATALAEVDAEAAFLLGWSSVEGLARNLQQGDERISRIDLSSLKASLGDSGRIGEREAAVLQVSNRRRSSLAHGTPTLGVSAEDVFALAEIGHQLLSLLQQPHRSTLLDEEPISVGTQEYPFRAYRNDGGEVVGIVEDTLGATSLMNASERIYRAVQARYPGARVVEYWPRDPGFGPYRVSDGEGGSLPITLEEMGLRLAS